MSAEIRPPVIGSTCPDCGGVIFGSVSCNPHHITVRRRAVECWRYRDELAVMSDGDDLVEELAAIVDGDDLDLDPEHRCRSCGIGVDGFHHLGCGVERCPVEGCGEQLLFCHHATFSPWHRLLRWCRRAWARRPF